MIEIEAFTLKQARKSTMVVAGVLVVLAALQAYRGHSGAVTLLGASAAGLLVCAGSAPAAMWFHKWWMTGAVALGYVNSRLLLFVLYYAVITPIGLIVRWSGHDPLDRRHGAAGSYWRPRAHTRQTRESFERAF